MLRITQELIAEAMVSGTLTTLADPIAHALLESNETVDDCLELAAVEGRAGVSHVLGDLIDLACTHGDVAMREMPALKGWHTFGMSALLRSTSDHRLYSIHDSRQLERQLSDALGLDYGSLKIGPYALHSLSALAMPASDFTKTCATMRLEAARAMPAGVESFYGLNERGTKDVHLAQQVQLFVNVKASSAEDARQMAREMHQWVSSATRNSTLEFRLVDGSELTVNCLPLMAGLPWTLRRTAAYEIQSLVLAELAELWSVQHAAEAERRQFSTVLDFDANADVQAVRLVAWFGSEPTEVHAAQLATSVSGELLEDKLSRRLVAAGWSHVELASEECPLKGSIRIKSDPLPVIWDPRFAP